jgi:hypothetical protein
MFAAAFATDVPSSTEETEEYESDGSDESTLVAGATFRRRSDADAS